MVQYERQGQFNAPNRYPGYIVVLEEYTLRHCKYHYLQKEKKGVVGRFLLPYLWTILNFSLDTDSGKHVWNFPRIDAPQLRSIAGILGTTDKHHGSTLTLSPNWSARTKRAMTPSATNS